MRGNLEGWMLHIACTSRSLFHMRIIKRRKKFIMPNSRLNSPSRFFCPSHCWRLDEQLRIQILNKYGNNIGKHESHTTKPN